MIVDQGSSLNSEQLELTKLFGKLKHPLYINLDLSIHIKVIFV